MGRRGKYQYRNKIMKQQHLKSIEKQRSKEKYKVTFPKKGQKGFQSNVPLNLGKHKDKHKRSSRLT